MCIWKISISTCSRNKSQANNTIKLHASHRSLNNQLLKNFTICCHWSSKTEAFSHVTDHDNQNITGWKMLTSFPPLSYLLLLFLMKTWAMQTKERGGYFPTPSPNWALTSSNSFLLPWAAWHCLIWPCTAIILGGS